MSAVEYVGASGATAGLGMKAVTCECGEWRDLSSEFDVSNGRLFATSFKPFERELAIVADCPSEAEASGLIERMMRVLRADAESCVPGRLFWGEWYARCVLKGYGFEGAWAGRSGFRATLTFLVTDPLWTRERTWAFGASDAAKALGYPHGYPHGYGSASPVERIECDSIRPCDVRIEVRGPCDAPSVSIGGNSYRSSAYVPEGARLLIDTREKRCAIETADGLSVDALPTTPDAPPGSGSYAFEAVPPGSSLLAWDRSFGLSVTVFETKAVRPWT